MDKNNKTNLSVASITVLLILGISIIYIGITVSNLWPYLNELKIGKFIIEPNDLPNYSDVFNSIFVVINIVMTSILSYSIYKINRDSNNNSYNKDVSGSATLLYIALKFNIMRSISTYLIDNKSILKDEVYIEKESKKKKSYLKRIEETKFRKLDKGEKLDEYLKPVIGEIEDVKLRWKLYTLCEDVTNAYKESGDIKCQLTYTISKNLLNDGKLEEESCKKWSKILDNIYFQDDWNCLDSQYCEVMNILRDVCKKK